MADTYTVQRSATITAPPSAVFERITNFHDWQAWSPWEDVDPELRRSYDGPESGVGAQYRWSGNRQAGAGSMEIVEAEAPHRVRIDLRFDKPFKARNDLEFRIDPDGSGSRVTWTMTGRETLMLRVMGVFKSMDSMIGPDFEKGLARLQRAVDGRQ